VNRPFHPYPRRTAAAVALAVLALSVACAPGAGSGGSQSQAGAPAGAGGGQSGAGDAGWNDLVAAARREGEVVIYGPPGAMYREALVQPFETAYPGIKVTFTGATGSDIGPRLLAERQAGKYIPDIHIGGTTTPNEALKPTGALEPLPPLLIRPDVTDTAKWFDNQLWYADEEGQFNLMFEGGLSTILAVNKSQVDPNGFTSYWDALDPRYRGRVVVSDIRRPGPGGGAARFVWATEGLGPAYLERVYGEMDATVTEDRRQLADWLAQGRFAVAVFPGGEIEEAIRHGLPLAKVDLRRLKEGFPVSAAFGALVVITPRPHPNATTVYVNWLLSPEGQLAWQRATEGNSLRTDVPKDMVDPLTIPPPGGKVFMSSLEKYATLELAPVRALVTKAMENKR
jgi:iron(III) transport system substrate-binding protein